MSCFFSMCFDGQVTLQKQISTAKRKQKHCLPWFLSRGLRHIWHIVVLLSTFSLLIEKCACMDLLPPTGGAPSARALPTNPVTIMGRSSGPALCLTQHNDVGVCVFLKTCLEMNGRLQGTCAKSFFFASCCVLPNATSLNGTNNQEALQLLSSFVEKDTSLLTNLISPPVSLLSAVKKNTKSTTPYRPAVIISNAVPSTLTRTTSSLPAPTGNEMPATKSISSVTSASSIEISSYDTLSSTNRVPTTKSTTMTGSTFASSPMTVLQLASHSVLPAINTADHTARPSAMMPTITVPVTTTLLKLTEAQISGNLTRNEVLSLSGATLPPGYFVLGNQEATTGTTGRRIFSPEWTSTEASVTPEHKLDAPTHHHDNESSTESWNATFIPSSLPTITTTASQFTILDVLTAAEGPAISLVTVDLENSTMATSTKPMMSVLTTPVYVTTTTQATIPSTSTVSPSPSLATSSARTSPLITVTTTITSPSPTSFPVTTTSVSSRNVTSHTPSSNSTASLTSVTSTDPGQEEAQTDLDVASSSSNTTTPATDADGQTPVTLSDICGITPLLWQRDSGRDARIVGGTEAKFGEFPWQVSLRRIVGQISSHRCGAALVHPRWVITAAHCASDIPTNRMVVRIGEYDFRDANSTYPHVDIRVAERVIHQKFNFLTFENDIALLRLAEPVKLAPHIIPVCLAPYKNYTGSYGTISGWGRLSQGGALPPALHKVEVPFIGKKDCETWFDDGDRHQDIEPVFICAGYKNGGRDACQGDSGGPVVQKVDGRWGLVGVISWGIGCAEPNLPGVSTLIPLFADWIKANSEGDVYLPDFYLKKYGPAPAISSLSKVPRRLMQL